jgi:hypothetical protein
VNFRDLTPLERRSFDLYITQAQQANPQAVLGRVGDPRPEAGATVVPFADSKSGSRYEVFVWPDGSVNGFRAVA